MSMPTPAPTRSITGASNPHALEIMEVTIRDGSYAIDFQFTQEDIRFLCAALQQLGFRYIEVGHGLGLNASVVKAASAASDDDYLSAAREVLDQSQFGTFFIPEIGRMEDMKRAREEYGMHFIRVGYDATKIEQTAPYLEYARDLGYEVMSNFMKTNLLTPRAVAEKCRTLVDAGAQVVYVVDSTGGMLPDEVGDYVKAIADLVDVRIGFHGHNNLEMACANSVSAMHAGATLIDTSIGGLGRSAGNTRTELMIPILQRLGVALDYDLLQTVRVLDTFIRPLLRRQPVSSIPVLTGYARIHSGLMKPFEQTAAEHGVPLDDLLVAYAATADEKGEGAPVADLARELSRDRAQRDPRGARAETPTEADNVLLQVNEDGNSAEMIKNSFVTIDRLLASIRVLARKANLPVVALVDFGGLSDEDDSVMAEYLYHDDHFIVLRVLFSSVEQFERFMDTHRGTVDIIVLEEIGDVTNARLRARRAEWDHGERVLYLNRRVTNYHYLLSAIHTHAYASPGRHVLLFGGDPELFARHVPAEMQRFTYYSAGSDADAPERMGFYHLDVPRVSRAAEPESRELLFHVVVLLSAINREELMQIVERMESGGIVIDCLGQNLSRQPAFADAGVRVVDLDLPKSISGELVGLLAGTRE